MQWSAWLLRDRGYTYVYGVEDLGASKYQHVARVRGDDLTAKPWEYWTGTGWSADETGVGAGARRRRQRAQRDALA